MTKILNFKKLFIRTRQFFDEWVLSETCYIYIRFFSSAGCPTCDLNKNATRSTIIYRGQLDEIGQLPDSLCCKFRYLVSVVELPPQCWRYANTVLPHTTEKLQSIENFGGSSQTIALTNHFSQIFLYIFLLYALFFFSIFFFYLIFCYEPEKKEKI